MSGKFKTDVETPFDYVLESAVVTSIKFNAGAEVELKNVITDLEIYEHIDKPYLTGNLIVVDDSSLYNNVSFSGSEKLTIKISLNGEKTITKSFIIEKTVKNARGNDRSSAVLFHLVEDHGFESTVRNVNKAYSGKPVDVVKKIMTDNLGKEFSDTAIDDAQEPIKVLVPNMTPIAAARWVMNRATTLNGTPYYLFSTFANEKLHVISLDTMLSAQPDTKAYLYSQIATSFSSSSGVDDQAYLIQDYKSKANDEIVSLVHNGFMGSQNYFYDPLIGSFTQKRGTFFDLEKVLDNLKSKEVIRKNQSKLDYVNGYEIDGIPISKYKSKVSTNVVTTNTYSDINNYNQASNLSGHRLKVIAEALRELIVRNVIEVTLPGRNFLNADYHSSIGNQIKMRFLGSDVTGSDAIDTKKSGDYLVYAVKHQFKKERYDVVASCVKLADLNEEPE